MNWLCLYNREGAPYLLFSFLVPAKQHNAIPVALSLLEEDKIGGGRLKEIFLYNGV